MTQDPFEQFMSLGLPEGFEFVSRFCDLSDGLNRYRFIVKVTKAAYNRYKRDGMPDFDAISDKSRKRDKPMIIVTMRSDSRDSHCFEKAEIVEG